DRRSAPMESVGADRQGAGPVHKKEPRSSCCPSSDIAICFVQPQPAGSKICGRATQARSKLGERHGGIVADRFAGAEGGGAGQKVILLSDPTWSVGMRRESPC